MPVSEDKLSELLMFFVDFLIRVHGSIGDALINIITYALRVNIHRPKDLLSICVNEQTPDTYISIHRCL